MAVNKGRHLKKGTAKIWVERIRAREPGAFEDFISLPAKRRQLARASRRYGVSRARLMKMLFLRMLKDSATILPGQTISFSQLDLRRKKIEEKKAEQKRHLAETSVASAKPPIVTDVNRLEQKEQTERWNSFFEALEKHLNNKFLLDSRKREASERAQVHLVAFRLWLSGHTSHEIASILGFRKTWSAVDKINRVIREIKIFRPLRQAAEELLEK